METVIRVAIFYVAILLGLRVLGKREFSQLSPVELVTLLLIPELVQQGLVRDDFSLTNGLVAVSTLFVLVFVTSMLAQRFAGVERVLSSSPAVLVSRGRIVEDTLAHERVTSDELYAEIRKAGLERVAQVRWAILESDGRISVVAEEGPASTQPQRSEAAV